MNAAKYERQQEEMRNGFMAQLNAQGDQALLKKQQMERLLAICCLDQFDAPLQIRLPGPQLSYTILLRLERENDGCNRPERFSNDNKLIHVVMCSDSGASFLQLS